MTDVLKSAGITARFRLAKVPLCLLIGVSSLFGYILANPNITIKMWLVGIGIFILACGAATLNSLQEYRLDGQMERTKSRPLPSGLLAPRQAGIQALFLLLTGLSILHFALDTLFPLLVALASVILYNGIYTPLKARTVLAIVPGALCGALPPYIGWLGGGGGIVNYTATLLIALFVLWQVPHFWLVMLSFQEDYVDCRMPSLLIQFQESSLKRFFVTWIGALVSVMLMFLILPYGFGYQFHVALMVNGCLLFAIFIYGLAIRKEFSYRILFIILNAALFLHMVIVASARILAR